MNNNWPDGIYEKVINLQMKTDLQEFDEKAVYIEKIDPEEAPSILSEYVAKILKHKLQSVQEEKDSIVDQIAVVNSIVELLNENTDSEMIKVTDEGEQLKALSINNPIMQVTHKKANGLVRPTTSIADTSLFTGAIREPNMSSELNNEIASCDRIDMMVSFIRWSGVVLIIDELRKFAESGKKIRVITTSYMGATEFRAIEELSKLPNTEIKVSFDGDRTRLHSKVYIFYRKTGYSTAYIGSSNLTAPAMTSGCEWNVKVTKNDLPEVFDKVEASFEGTWNSKEYDLYSNDKRELLIESLKRSNGNAKIHTIKRRFFLDVHPYPYQQAILDKIEAEREIHNSYKNLICAATGTGKTIISAFDYRAQCKKSKRRLKLLFVAHRREILEQSIECYREIMKDSEFAEVFYSGNEPTQLDYLFASIEILNSRKITRLAPDYYDYIVVDECHHLAADSYKNIFNHFTPKFLVGLTATPERADGKSILSFFNDKLAAEIRLPEAINRKLLCPFLYFGVADTVDLSNLKWSRGGYDINDLKNVYVFKHKIAEKRAERIIQSIFQYIANVDTVKGLVFCVSVEHAVFMSNKLNAAGIASESLTGESNDQTRALVKNKLLNGKIKFVCVVDLYNEGVDIKEINTILFLRPTESLTVFLQQLGRGLRLCEGKDCLTVLDFVGQANKKYSFFESKYSALLQNNNQGLRKEIANGFQHLPKGCYVKLEKKAEKAILNNINDSLRTESFISSKIKSFKMDFDEDFSLKKFLDYYSLIPQAIYKHKITATETLGLTNNGYDPDISKKLFRLSSVDSREFLLYMKQHLDLIDSLSEDDLDTKAIFCWKLMLATFIDDFKPKNNRDVLIKMKEYWYQNRCFITETVEILNYTYDKLDFVEVESNLPYSNILKVYSTYTRAQALSLLDYWNKSSEGVTRVKDKNTTCLFVTLNKSNNYYSPSTAYKDYSINAELFHWQSQNATSAKTKVGKRFIEHKELGETILLFVREQKSDKYGAVPFVFLGRANFVSYQGEKPMSIVWKLENKIPARFIEVTDKLGIV